MLWQPVLVNPTQLMINHQSADSDHRPNPDALLAQVKREAAQSTRGKLKIFFGASAGVGKTYAMLQDARRLREEHVDVVVGLIETHGRQDTAALLVDLPQLPRRAVQYESRTLTEFDLDAALARHPRVLLVDELAHSNAPGSRHPKRWQDIDELLAAGVDVHTTMNVQHLESLNDVVGGITQIRVHETVPDHVFDAAHEIVLVDLPTDDLLRRLAEGKVYLPEQAERAKKNFFRPGNLIALRELALRRTADRVDDEVRRFRRAQIKPSSSSVWHTGNAILAAVGPGIGDEALVRAAARYAAMRDTRWHAVYVETPALARLSSARRQRILATLTLAESLGAATATLAAPHSAPALIAYAREHNLGTLVVGRPRIGQLAWRNLWRFGGTGLIDQLANQAPEIAVLIAPADRHDMARSSTRPTTEPPRRRKSALRGYAWAIGACAAVSVAATPLHGLLELSNIVMLFLLAVAGVAWRFGRRPALLAAVINVLAFDFFFVPPRLSFAVSDVQYLITFSVMIIVGLAIGQLTAQLRYQARVALDREGRARQLYETARALGAALTIEQIASIGDRAVEAAFQAKAAVLTLDAQDHLQCHDVADSPLPAIDMGLAQWSFDHAEPAGFSTDTLPASAVLYLPLKAPMRVRGILAIEPRRTRRLLIPEQKRLLDTYATLIAIAIERVHFVSVAQQTLVTMESERLRHSLLAALSHDLRTPLTALLGHGERLADALRDEASAHASIAMTIVEQAQRTSRMVTNLLDMARLQSGAVTLRSDWLSVEELVGGARRSIEAALAAHPLSTHWVNPLPLLHGDAVLLERVLVNLLDNAVKHTPAGTPIDIEATAQSRRFIITVSDRGPGFDGDPEALFEAFKRGEKESATSGVGLGLSICRAIIEAHGGTLKAVNQPAPGHGARFEIVLPQPEQPVLADE